MIHNTPEKMNNQNRPPQPEGTSWDEETQEWLTPEQLLELAGDFVISENEYWDNLTDEEMEKIARELFNGVSEMLKDEDE
tara:strand:+ start:74 stop:313 length:240 start_codon:yes stop_codon:yes gene_type:complete